ncbi:hypothetical protein ACFOLL_04530 [Falsochrobactrum ovis]|uniref:Uncharacterized protein n=1 Tax=Falsochrobactrum ovis TaxID=1293442 RepID=A0A364JVX8_9HYPH|nr:hypothetical protein [Falsochrobactrum ovis]RAK29117.1 hypothetical protein C7374_105168 [Falsochrobactrum ovis]
MAYIEFDPYDYIDEITTKQLVRELEGRRADGDSDAHTDRAWREWVMLAELIAEGRKSDALDLLARLAPVEINPITTINCVQMRMAVHHA